MGNYRCFKLSGNPNRFTFLIDHIECTVGFGFKRREGIHRWEKGGRHGVKQARCLVR